MINNLETGLRFCDTTRRILEIDPTRWFNPTHMHNIADKFKIFGAFNCDRNHWRLVLKVYKDRSMLVYDPLYQKKGKSVYRYWSLRDSVTIISEPLQDHYGLETMGIELNEKSQRDMLREHDYDLNIPRPHFLDMVIQEDAWNCGPLVLYAALCADKYTPEFKDKADFREVRQTAGIEIF